MKVLTRISLFVPLVALLGAQSCVTDNPAAYTGILGETRPPPSEAPSTSNGGSGTTGGTGASSVTNTTGAAAGAAGASAGAGGEGSGETTSDGSTNGGEETFECVKPEDDRYAPRCCESTTEYGEEIKKGTQCSPNDLQRCYRECGPASTGWKEENCQAGVYAEENCVFPPEVDFSCYKIPDTIDEAVCGVDEAPRATDPCDAPVCTLCNFEGRYVDTGEASKEGWCVCREPDENGLRTWTCASETAWPCPLGSGC